MGKQVVINIAKSERRGRGGGRYKAEMISSAKSGT